MPSETLQKRVLKSTSVKKIIRTPFLGGSAILEIVSKLKIIFHFTQWLQMFYKYPLNMYTKIIFLNIDMKILKKAELS